MDSNPPPVTQGTLLAGEPSPAWLRLQEKSLRNGPIIDEDEYTMCADLGQREKSKAKAWQFFFLPVYRTCRVGGRLG